jgi:hypothetical protein
MVLSVQRPADAGSFYAGKRRPLYDDREISVEAAQGSAAIGPDNPASRGENRPLAGRAARGENGLELLPQSG